MPVTLTPAVVGSASLVPDPQLGLFPGLAVYPGTGVYPEPDSIELSASLDPDPTRSNFECFCSTTRTCDPYTPCNVPAYLNPTGLTLFPGTTVYPDLNLYPL